MTERQEDQALSERLAAENRAACERQRQTDAVDRHFAPMTSQQQIEQYRALYGPDAGAVQIRDQQMAERYRAGLIADTTPDDKL